MGSNQSVQESVAETTSNVEAQGALIEAINELYNKLTARFDSDFAKMDDAIVLFKHENFKFEYKSADQVAGIVDSVADGLEALKPKIPEAKSLDVSKYSNQAIQTLLDTNIGKALDQLTGLFVMIAPQLGGRTGTTYEWSTDMRLLDSNLFLYNAAFLYKFENKAWFSSKSVVAVGYFSYIFQSNAFADNFLELSRKLFLLDEFDIKKLQLIKAETKINEMIEECAAKGDFESMSKFDVYQKIITTKRKALLGEE
jgi:hypothetical protein